MHLITTDKSMMDHLDQALFSPGRMKLFIPVKEQNEQCCKSELMHFSNYAPVSHFTTTFLKYLPST